MSDKSNIEWTDATWNPIRGTKGRHHCVRISEGCKHCYAATMNHRFNGPDYVKGADTPRLDETALLWPLRWKGAKEAKAEGRASRIFVCSMTDLFMDEHTDEMIGRVWGMMEQAHQHTFQVLTKRAKRMREWVSSFPKHMTLQNVWLGVSAETQARAEERIPHLMNTPAAIRFLSLEPLLGPITLDCGEGLRVFAETGPWGPEYDHWYPLSGLRGNKGGGITKDPVHWVIVGGESGPGARPCDVSWIRSIKDQCQAAEVPVFIKQLGAVPCLSERLVGWADHVEFRQDTRATNIIRLKDKKGGDPSEWPADLRAREFPR